VPLCPFEAERGVPIVEDERHALVHTDVVEETVEILTVLDDPVAPRPAPGQLRRVTAGTRSALGGLGAERVV
jgi:hypothetical protein